MVAQILPFPKAGSSTLTPLSCFVRIGEAHRQLSAIHAAGHLPARQAVFDASRFRHQRELVGAFRDAGTQLVLDTEAAELASPAKCGSHSRRAPWAREDGSILGPNAFRGSALDELVGQIATFAVENHINTVLAPTHFLGDPAFLEWLAIDQATCLALRRALDREGGTAIAIDYPVILPNGLLNDAAARGRILTLLGDLPVENVWIRSSGFGSDAGPLATRRFLTSVSGFHNLGKPLIADYVGGLVGQTALAFGAVSAIARGVSERERFDAREWHKEPKQPDEEATGFGRVTRVTIPDFHRSLTVKELEVLCSAKSGRRVCGCGDRTCCQSGYSDMITDHRGHAARQLFRSVDAIEKVPDLLREKSFLDSQMASAERKAREVRGLKPSAAEAQRHGIKLDEMMKRLCDYSRKIERFQATLENLHETRGEAVPRARAIQPFKASEPRSSQNKP